MSKYQLYKDNGITTGVMIGIFVIYLLLSLISKAWALEATSSTKWVQGSWVNLRAQPDIKANIIQRLPANTKVIISSNNDEWCKIRMLTSNVEGFMSCRLLGNEPLSINIVGRKELLSGEKNLDYSALKAFWIAPSLKRLLEAGNFYWDRMLSEKKKANEHPKDFHNTADGQSSFNWDSPPQPSRSKIKEFEAMKALLMQGIVAHSERRPTIVPWSEIDEIDTSHSRNSIAIKAFWLDAEHIELMKLGRSPEIEPSLFKNLNDVAPPSSSVEELSAQFAIPQRLKILSGPKWVFFRHEDPRVAGSWDIGSTELSLENPVVEYRIDRSGKAGVYEYNAKAIYDITKSDSCEEGFSFKPRAQIKLTGDSEIETPLIWIYLKKSLPQTKVNIKKYARRLNIEFRRNTMFDLSRSMLVMHEIDLDADNVVDLAAWEVRSSGNKYALMKIYLANINGEWNLLDVDIFNDFCD